MLETVARMIILAERDTSYPNDAEMTTTEVTVKATKKQKNVLTKIVNWITKHSKEDAPGGKKSAAPKGAEGSPTNDGERNTSAKVVALPADACQSAMKKIMDKLVQFITKFKDEGGKLEDLSHPLTKQLLRSL